MPHLRGQSVMLREYRMEDLVPIRQWVNDPAIVVHLSDIFLYPHTLDATQSFVEAMMEGKSDNSKGFVIADARTELYIGQISLDSIDWKNRVASVGIVIGSAESQGLGYGTEAMNLLIRFAFEELNLHRLELQVYDFNERGYRCYVRCGFVEEGRLRQKQYRNGRYADVILMGLLRSDWETREGGS